MRKLLEDGKTAFGCGEYATAFQLWQQLADQGDACVQALVGSSYSNGLGVIRDYVEAHKWYNLSAARATEKDTRDMATYNRDVVAAKMTPAQIAEAQKLAREWKPTTAP
jgi:TPR repeat protein